MRSVTRMILCTACVVMATGIVATAADREAPTKATRGDDRAGTCAASSVSVPQELATQPLPLDATFRRSYAGAEPRDGEVAGVSGSELVYSNTLGNFVFGPNAGLRVADDIVTTAKAGCALDKFVFRVSGDKDNNPLVDEGPFSVDYALYSTCPGASLFPVPIPGTTGTEFLPDEGFHEITVTIPEYACVGGDNAGQACVFGSGTCTPGGGFCELNEIELPSALYFAVTFSRNNAGIVVGSPATVGHSSDLFDFPGFACSSAFGGFPLGPHASFWVEFYVKGGCETSFAGYRNARQSGPPYSEGASSVFADDVEFGVPIGGASAGCNMIAYEVSMRGEMVNSSGAVQTQLHEFLDNEEPLSAGMIPGTRRQKFLYGNRVQVLRANFSTPIPLSLQQLYMVFKTGSGVVGPLRTCQDATIGSTLDLLWSHDNGAWSAAALPIINCHAAMDITIFCEGDPPPGACCDMILTEDNTCVGGSYPNQPCVSNDDCVCEPMCQDGSCQNFACAGGPRPGEFCTNDSQCLCPALECIGNICVGGPNDGETCVTEDDCNFPQPCTTDGNCVGDAVCREVAEMNCAYPDLWAEDGRCLPVCVGGPNDGLLCADAADCPSVCYLGDNHGLPCTVPADCPGGACDAGVCAGSFCDGGTNDGLPCSRHADCPGEKPNGDPAECAGQPFPNDRGCGLGSCCGCAEGQCGINATECWDVTEKGCFEATAGGQHLFNRGGSCASTRCPWGACLGREGECTLPRPTFCIGGDRDGEPCNPDEYLPNECPPGSPIASCPGVPGCGDPFCCTDVCNTDSFCCNVWWDSYCATTAFSVCGTRPPANDVCFDNADPNRGALVLDIPSVVETDGIKAQNYSGDPGFCCKLNDVGGVGVGTTWFKFVAEDPGNPSAVTVSAEISTCQSVGRTVEGTYYPADDSMIQVFSVKDPDAGSCANLSPCSVSAQDCTDGSICEIDPQRACENLVPIACNDDFGPGCTNPVGGPQYENSRVCVPDLVVGQTYYFMVAAKTPENRGVFRVAISAPCGVGLTRIPNDLCDEATEVSGANMSIPFNLEGMTCSAGVNQGEICGYDADCPGGNCNLPGHTPVTFDCPGPPDTCMRTMQDDIWYNWTAPANGAVNINTCGGGNPTPDTAMVVYAGCECPPDPFDIVGCSDFVSGLSCLAGSEVKFNAVKDQCYQIRTGGRLGAVVAGHQNITLSECPNGPVVFLDPPGGIVDARQPYAPDDPGTLQGISSILVQAPPGADMRDRFGGELSCWSLCETELDAGFTQNDIFSVTNNGDGTYTLQLRRPITQNAVTTLTFTHGDGSTTVGQFTSHPGNVDGVGPAEGMDVLSLMAGLDPDRGYCTDGSICSLSGFPCADASTCTAPAGPNDPIYGADIDQSGMFTPADVLRLIDGLNGVGAFDPWLGTPLPDCGFCCPVVP